MERMFKLSETQLNQLLQYLVSKPYGEVQGLIVMIQTAPIIDAGNDTKQPKKEAK